MDELNRLRDEIDRLDGDLLKILARRMECAQLIGEAKEEVVLPLRDADREEEVLKRIRRSAEETGLEPSFAAEIFRSVIHRSLRLQTTQRLLRLQETGAVQLKVAYQGIPGAYSALAGRKFFGSGVQLVGFPTFRAVLEAVVERECHYAVLPIENTTAGSINEVYDLLLRTDCSIVGEEIWRVDHCLIGPADVPLHLIRRICSHPQALIQCSNFLESLTHCVLESYMDTAAAVDKIRRDDDITQAAIASPKAAEEYHLHIIRENIANQKENYTRFVVVAGEPRQCDPSVPCMTSVVFATRHEKGALASCLDTLAEHGINLTKLESRPQPNKPWQYYFYVDFEGSTAEPRTAEALESLKRTARFVKILGSYPRSGVTHEENVGESRLRSFYETYGTLPPAVSQAPRPDGAPLLPRESRDFKLVLRESQSQDTIVKVGGAFIGTGRPFAVIAGPCSVESPEMIMECAREVATCGGQVLRGGCFRPRTSPYSFQGLGYEGVELLAGAGRAFGLPVITEVLEVSQIEQVADQVDIIQIGARNMQNFALLKEVGRIDKPVLLKRGMMAPIKEYLAAAEYILEAGNQQVLLCERGIRTFETMTRYTLDLSAVPVLRELTHLPILVDPSHAAGDFRWIIPLVRAAFAVGAHGIMVEIHPEPPKALSDGKQSLDFALFRKMMLELGFLEKMDQP
jgi:chorismate mutase/prephenate dehydratase